MYQRFTKFAALLFVLFIFKSLLIAQVYQVQPDVSSCTAGVLTQQEKDKILERVNFIRSLHKLKPVIWETAGDRMSMEGCLNIVASGQSGHVDDPSSACYTPGGGQARLKSNLYAGQSSGSIGDPSVDIIVGWMLDDHNADQANEYKVGHRRAIINPFLTRFSFGRAEGVPKSGGGNWSASNFLYQDFTDGKITDTDLEFIAYPYEYYPPSFFNKEFYLSFNAIADKSNLWGNQSVSYANTTVEMVDESNSQMNVHDVLNDNEGWGSFPNNLSWKVDGLRDEVKYTVTVKGTIVGGKSKDFTYWFKFTSKNQTVKPASPVALAPLNNATSVKTTINFSWNLTTNTNKYLFELAYDDKFTDMVLSEKGLPLNGYLMKAGILKTKTQYYWRIAAMNDAGQSDWSPTWNFTTVGEKPAQAALTGPTDNSTNVSRTPKMEWKDLPGADTYSIQIAKDNTFDPLVLKVSKSSIVDNFYVVPAGRLDKNTKYWWRIKGANIAGDGDYSAIWNFTTNTEIPIPAPIEPVNNATNQSLSLQLRWTTNSEAIAYFLNISEKFDFSNLTFEKKDLDINLFKIPTGTLNTETKYFWRVKAQTSTGVESFWSDVWSFTTTSSTGVEELNQSIIIAPNPVNEYINLSIDNINNENFMLSLVDISGKLMFIDHLNSNSLRINTKEIPAGKYIVYISSGKKSISREIIILK